MKLKIHLQIIIAMALGVIAGLLLGEQENVVLFVILDIKLETANGIIII